jgi:hypothetical protein
MAAGSAGRGNRTLVDPDQVHAWCRARDSDEAIERLASELPSLLAQAMLDAFKDIESPSKAQLGPLLAGSW